MARCEKSLEKLTEDLLTERNTKIEMQKEILEEYKKIKHTYEDLARNMKEELATANDLRRERNELLRQFILQKE